MSDMVVAARRYLAAQPGLTALLGSDATYSTWIFRWRPYVEVEHSGKAAVVVSRRPGGAPNRHNHMDWPQLQVEIFADEDRNAQGNPANAAKAEDRCQAVFAELDKYLHRPEKGALMWDTLRVLSSERNGGIDITEVPGGDGLVRGLVAYDVSLG